MESATETKRDDKRLGVADTMDDRTEKCGRAAAILMKVLTHRGRVAYARATREDVTTALILLALLILTATMTADTRTFRLSIRHEIVLLFNSRNVVTAISATHVDITGVVKLALQLTDAGLQLSYAVVLKTNTLAAGARV